MLFRSNKCAPKGQEASLVNKRSVQSYSKAPKNIRKYNMSLMFYRKNPTTEKGKAIESLVLAAASSEPPAPGTSAATGEHATWGNVGDGSRTAGDEDPPERHIGQEE